MCCDIILISCKKFSKLMPMKRQQVDHIHEIVCPHCGGKIDIEIIVNVFGGKEKEKK